MPSITCLVTMKALFRLVLITAIQSESDIFFSMLSRTMPALLTRMSTGPISDSILRTIAAAES